MRRGSTRRVYLVSVWLSLLLAQVGLATVAVAQTGSEKVESDTTQARADRRASVRRERAAEMNPWTIVATVSNGLVSNVTFDQEGRDAYALVLGGAIAYEGDDFELGYELAGHRYTNTSRWDRISHHFEAELEQDLPGNWDFEAVGQINFKGSSEDRDLVDQDFEVEPRIQYHFTPERRLRLFTTHRLKRYHDAPETNAVKHYFGAELRETMGPGDYWEVGGRFETNEERLDRGDYRRWTYWLEHGIQLTESGRLVMRVRYRFKRYSHRFVEAEDEEVLRTDHRFVPSIAWVRSLGPRLDVRFDYTYETNYSNDPEKVYGAHLGWMSLDLRW